MNMVFRQVAEHLQVEYIAGDVDGRTVTTTLTILAGALVGLGWNARGVEYEIAHFEGWPIIIKALKATQGM